MIMKLWSQRISVIVNCTLLTMDCCLLLVSWPSLLSQLKRRKKILNLLFWQCSCLCWINSVIHVDYYKKLCKDEIESCHAKADFIMSSMYNTVFSLFWKVPSRINLSIDIICVTWTWLVSFAWRGSDEKMSDYLKNLYILSSKL